MSKRKKLRTSGREGLHLRKLPKNPRIEDSDGATSQSSLLDCLHHPEESEGGSGLTPSAEQSGEEPGQAASSSPDNEADAPSRLLGQPEKEPAPLPPSQNSVGKFVPQFAKPRKTVTRQAERREERLGMGVFSSQAIWEGSPAMELDFLPDSQIQDALEAPGFEAPPEQLFPAGGELDPCRPGTGPRADRGSCAEAQPRTRVGIKTCEATGIEDATDTVRGLVMELSNLNRLIMSAHRDLETFKRLNYYRKAKPAGKAPTPYTAKGAGTLPRGEQSWRDL
uniref:Uncharacterized protein n=1 Tax=Ovis aries TaxID=9940 RepID=A0AC11ARM8_SHEEP